MKSVKSPPRFQCDFCKKRSVKHVIALHEKRCFRNPNRFCDYCQNTGEVEVDMSADYMYEAIAKVPCHYCAKFNAAQLAEIEARELSEKRTLNGDGHDDDANAEQRQAEIDLIF